MNCKNIISVYTDGATTINKDTGRYNNPGKGAYAYIVQCCDDMYTYSDNFVFTTNNRMELLAVNKGLFSLIKASNKNITLYSDSEYVVNTVNNGYLTNWINNSFYIGRGKRKLKKNIDLWMKLFYIMNQIKIKNRLNFKWIRGHSGIELNELADKLASDKANETATNTDYYYINEEKQIDFFHRNSMSLLI